MPRLRALLTLACAATAIGLASCGRSDTEALGRLQQRLPSLDAATARTELKKLVQAHPKSGPARLLLGQRYTDDGNAAAAASELQRALEHGAAEHLALPLLAEALLQSGQAGRVVHAYGTAVLADPDAQARLQAAVASAEAAVGNEAGARAALTRALQASPTSAHALLVQARFAASDNDLAGGMATVDGVLRDHPALTDAWLLKGELHLRQPDGRPAAQQAFTKAIDLRPDWTSPRMALMSLLVAQGDVDAARAQLAELRRRAPKDLNTAMAEGQLAFVDGQHLQAREIFQGVLRQLPENIGLLLTAGENELQLGAAQQAEVHFAKAVALAPGHATARRHLARAQILLGQMPKALATLAPLVDKADAGAEVLALAAEARRLNGEPRAAQAVIDRLARLQPADPRLRTMVAVAGFGRSDDHQVFDALARIAADTPDTSADLAMFHAHMARGQHREALKTLVQLERKLPQDATPAQLRGQVQVAMRQPAQARQSFAQALALQPGHVPSLLALSALDLREGQAAPARQRLADAVKADPRNSTARLALAEVLQHQQAPAADVRAQITAAVQVAPGDLAARRALVLHLLAAGQGEGALNAAQAAIAALPDNTELLTLLARCQLQLAQPSQALTTYGKITTLQPRSPQGHLGMADAYLANDQPALALGSIQRALELSPGLPDARERAIQVALHEKQVTRALDLARRIQTEHPGLALGFLREGEVLLQQRQWADAAAVLRQALTRPQPGQAPARLYQALTAGGRAGEADAFAAQWLQAHPADTGLLFAQAWAAQSAGQQALAQQRYERVLAHQSDHAAALNNLAMLRLAQQQPGALPLAERATAAAPGQPALLDTLAQAQAAESQLAAAVDTQRRAVALAQDAEGMRLTLARLLIQAGERAKAKAELERLAALGDGFAQQADVRQLLQTLAPALPGR